MEKKEVRIDAGLAGPDHYKLRLPAWRYRIRELLLPIVRWETPYVAYLQRSLRTPALDSYFAMTANLGTHTAFMVALPVLFWCGYMSLARGMIHILALGVYLSGFVKDLLCLPRPLSPPLTRITMSGSAALEYGFPSTHSTNAVSVAYYAIYTARHSNLAPNVNLALQSGLYFYAASIVLGRLYCGMHGFFDVVSGSALGAAIAAIQCHYGPAFDIWLYSSSTSGMALIAIVLIISIRIHPEPADNCPCFDDSVAFAGVMIGIEYACWQTATYAVPRTQTPIIPFDLQELGWLITILRTVLGVFTIFSWRATMKPLLLKILPPIFRVIETLGIDSPRRFFMRASQYTTIPRQKHGDNVIPSASDIPRMIANLSRQRAISVGPQSEADAREAIAFREKQRRDSLSKPAKPGSSQSHYFESHDTSTQIKRTHIRQRSSSIEEFRRQMGTSIDALSPVPIVTPGISAPLLDADEAKALLSHLHKPRVRYDVEVVTKLIVYTGIGHIAAFGNPMLFKLIGWST